MLNNTINQTTPYFYDDTQNKSHPPSPFSVGYLAPSMREACVASTLLAQMALALGSMIEYRSIPGPSTISLNFWLSWSFDK